VKAFVFDRSRPPLDVLELRELPPPPREPGEVLGKIAVASISPGDVLFTQGL
jgi:NADPH:quinone reductase-like Zn-dependent oxidoreductase